MVPEGQQTPLKSCGQHRGLVCSCNVFVFLWTKFWFLLFFFFVLTDLELKICATRKAGVKKNFTLPGRYWKVLCNTHTEFLGEKKKIYCLKTLKLQWLHVTTTKTYFTRLIQQRVLANKLYQWPQVAIMSSRDWKQSDKSLFYLIYKVSRLQQNIQQESMAQKQMMWSFRENAEKTS